MWVRIVNARVMSLYYKPSHVILITTEADYVPDEDESSDDSETLLEEEMLAQRDETLDPVDEINELEAVSDTRLNRNTSDETALLFLRSVEVFNAHLHALTHPVRITSSLWWS